VWEEHGWSKEEEAAFEGGGVAEADRPAAVVDCAIAGGGRGDVNGREGIYSGGLWGSDLRRLLKDIEDR